MPAAWQGSDHAPDAAPRHAIDGDVGLLERCQHAKVGEGAGAAARQHQPERPTSQPGDQGTQGSRGGRVDLGHLPGVEQLGPGEHLVRARVLPDEDQVRAGRELRGRAVWTLPTGGDGDHEVGLADRGGVPPLRIRPRHAVGVERRGQQHPVVVALEPLQPGDVDLAGDRDAEPAGEPDLHRIGHVGDRGPGVQTDDGDDGRLPLAFPDGWAGQLGGEHPHQRARRGRVLVDGPVQRVRCDAQEHRVTARPHGRTAHTPGEHGQLADDVTGSEGPHPAVCGEDVHPPAQDRERRAGGVACLEEDLPRVEPNPLARPFDALAAIRPELVHQGARDGDVGGGDDLRHRQQGGADFSGPFVDGLGPVPRTGRQEGHPGTQDEAGGAEDPAPPEGVRGAGRRRRADEHDEDRDPQDATDLPDAGVHGRRDRVTATRHGGQGCAAEDRKGGAHPQPAEDLAGQPVPEEARRRVDTRRHTRGRRWPTPALPARRPRGVHGAQRGDRARRPTPAATTAPGTRARPVLNTS